MGLVPTTDDWAPSYERDANGTLVSSPRDEHGDQADGGLVSVRYHSSGPSHCRPGIMNPPRVTVWGRDDTGMEKEYETDDDARRFVCHLPAYISMDWLIIQGFRWA